MKNSRICLLSYQANHRKTFDVMAGLKALGYENVCIYAKPFHYKKTFKPLYEHRPSCEFTLYQDVDYQRVIANYGYELRKIDSYDEINESEETIFLVCGAGLLPTDFYKTHIVINSHPGFIPLARGLDAFKWAIIENKPIGVTTHLIGDYVDAGEVIKRVEVPVFTNDTFHAVSERVYQTEVKLLLQSVEKHGISFTTDGEGNVVHKRMQADIEKNLLNAFEDWKNIHVSSK